MQRFPQNGLKGKKTNTVSLKLPNLQCIKMFNSNSSHSSSKMCVSEKKVCPEGFLGNVSFGEKNVYKFAKQTNKVSKTWLRSRKDVKLNFLLCSLPIFFFFSFLQSSVKGISLNEKLSAFSFFLFDLLFFFFLNNLIVCCN